MKLMYVARDHAVAGELVERAHELPATAAVLLLPPLPRNRRVAAAGLVLPRAYPLLQPVREREPPSVQEAVVEEINRLEGAHGADLTGFLSGECTVLVASPRTVWLRLNVP